MVKRPTVLVALLLFVWSASPIPAQELPAPSFPQLMERAQALLSARRPASRGRLRGLAEDLGKVNRAPLTDAEWTDLHIVTDEIRRRLTPMPARSGEPIPVAEWVALVPAKEHLSETSTAGLLRTALALGDLRAPAGGPPPSREDRARLRAARKELGALVTEIRGRAEAETERRSDALREAANRVRDFRFDLSCYAAGRVPAGRERFEWMLDMRHGLDLGAPGARTFGAREVVASLAALIQHANAHGGGKTWQEMTEAARDREPVFTSSAELLEFCRKTTKSAIEVAAASGLITVPDYAREPAVVLQTTSRPIPYAQFLPGQSRAQGIYRGTAVYIRVPEGLSEEEKRARFRDRDRTWLRAICPHEGVPGHHLQFAVASRLPGGVRRFGYNSVYVEGWGLYSEELMDRLGFFADPAQKTAVLRMKLWRAVRVLIDVGLHTGEVTPGRAVRMLTEIALLERSAAEAEVTRYLGSPTQPLSYMVGASKIRMMRTAWLDRHGDAKDDEREFHDRFLGLGPIPLDLAAAVLLDKRKPYDITHP